MTKKLTVSNQPVGGIPDFQVAQEMTAFLKTELAIEASDEARARLREIVRNFMADTKRYREAYSVGDIRSALEKLRGSAVELLSNLQTEPRDRWEIIRQLLISTAEEVPPNDASEDVDDKTSLPDNRRHLRQVIDEVQVSLLLLSRASGRAMRALEDQDGSQPGGYASAWRMFVPDLKAWVEDNSGIWKLPRNDTDKTLEYRSTPSLEFVKLILASLPSEPVNYRMPVHSDQALAKKIREALRKRGRIE